MTQPLAPPQDEGFPTGTVITAAAIGLALIALETRTRQQVEDDITAAFTAFAAYLLVVLASPAVIIGTGVELMSRPDVHTTLVTTITASKTAATATVTAGYTAAAHLAHAHLTASLRTAGYHVPADLPEPDPTLQHITADIDAMFGHTQTSIANTVTAAYDGIHGPNPDPARAVAVNQAITNATARLQQRAAAAAGTAVHRGSTDTQQGIYTQYQNTTATTGLHKRWITTSADPCGMCDALNGTHVPVNTEFDHHATTVEHDLRPVWRNLYGPPRHPNCRCQLELITT